MSDLISTPTSQAERLAAEVTRRETIMALPVFTLVRIGWEIEPGRIQGGIYYRIGDGLGPTTGELNARDNLNRAARWGGDARGQRWGMQILADPR